MDLLPNSAPLATKLRNTLIQYHSIGDNEWRVVKKTVSGLGGFVPATQFVLSRGKRASSAVQHGCQTFGKLLQGFHMRCPVKPAF